MTYSQELGPKFQGDVRDRDLARIAHDHYCLGGKQRARVVLQIQFPLPSIPPGLPLDLAAKVRDKVLAGAKETVLQAFDLATRSTFKYSDECILHGRSVAELTRRLHEDTVVYDRDYDRLKGIFFLARTDRTRAILALSSSTSCFDWSAYENPLYGPSKPAPRLLQWNIPKPGSSSDSGTLEPVNFADLVALRSEYTFLFPQRVYSAVTGNAGEPTLEHAVRDRDELWRSYFKRFTTIQEAAGQDGNLAYEASLDLNAFCQYGRRTPDLETR